MFYKFYKSGKVQILRWLKNPNCYGRKHGAYGIYLDAGETNAFQTAMVVGIKAERVLYTYIKGVCLDVRNVEYLDTCNKAECAINVGVMYNSVIYYKVGVMYDLVIYYKVRVMYNSGSRAECVDTYGKGECLDASSVGVMYNLVIYYKVEVMYNLVIYYKVEVIGAECLDTKKVECLDARRNVNAEFLDAGSRAECVDTYSKGEYLDASSNVEIKNEANRVGGLLRGPSGHNGVGGRVGGEIGMDIMVADIGMMEIVVADIGMMDIKVADIGLIDIMVVDIEMMDIKMCLVFLGGLLFLEVGPTGGQFSTTRT